MKSGRKTDGREEVHELHELHELEETRGVMERHIRHGDLSYAVVGCAQKVHREIGPGLPEIVYHRALCHELAKAGIPFESEKSLQVFYDGVLVGDFRADIVVDDKIILELKAVDRLVKAHKAQAITYLKASGLRVAILINFGTVSLETDRVVL